MADFTGRMDSAWTYTLVSVTIVSIVSLVGAFGFTLKADRLRKALIFLVSFAAGALFGDVFFHLLPEAVEKGGFSVQLSVSILFGIMLFFVIEKVIHWRHCHLPVTEDHVHSFALMNLIGDLVHNFLDGLIIGISYLVSIPVGIATTVAVILHEIPQEMADIGVLLHGGFSKRKALLYNFFTALTAVAGALAALLLGGNEVLLSLLIPLTAGGFIYIAGADLIPELHKEADAKKSLMQVLSIVLGFVVMYLLTFLG